MDADAEARLVVACSEPLVTAPPRGATFGPCCRCCWSRMTVVSVVALFIETASPVLGPGREKLVTNELVPSV